MGHDISAFRSKKTLKAYLGLGVEDMKESALEVAYLRRNMASSDIHEFYKSLDAEAEDCGVSGCGTEKTFTKKQIENAKRRMLAQQFDYESEKDYVEFFDACLKNLSPQGKILVTFS